MSSTKDVTNPRRFANNHSKWSDYSSGLSREVADPSQWGIYYTSNRDSTLFYQSNEQAIFKRLELVDPDHKHWDYYSASHWACGYVDGIRVRPLNPGTKRGTSKQYTPVYNELCEIMYELENYPLLDENDYSEREMLATFENIKSELGYTIRKNYLPIEITDNLISDITNWLESDNPNCLESRDDSGGWVSSEQLLEALKGIGLIKPCMYCQETTQNAYVCDDCLDAGIDENDYKPINDPSLYDKTLL